MFQSDESLGIVLLLMSLACLGTWPALLRLTSVQESEELVETRRRSCYEFMRGQYSSLPLAYRSDPLSGYFSGSCCTCLSSPRVRNLCHVYIDYATAYLVISSIPFIAVEVFAKSSSVRDNYNVMSPACVLVSMVGGAMLSCGNLSMQWATAVYRAPLTTVLALQASLTVALGTGINYLLQPSQTPQPGFLLGGVLVFFVAIGLATAAQLMYKRVQQERVKEIELPQDPHSPYQKDNAQNESTCQYEDCQFGNERASSIYGSDSMDEAPDNVVASTTQRSATVGVLVAAVGGLCFGFFSPAFNIAVNDPFKWSHNDQQHSVGSDHSDMMLVALANLYFSCAFWVTSLVGNFLLLYMCHPHKGMHAPSFILKSILYDYLGQDVFSDRMVAWMAGLVCAVGNVLQFQGGQLVGYATADLVQAYPLVSTGWDIFLFGEFREVRVRSTLTFLLVGMYAAYFGGVILLVTSSMSP